MLTGYRRAQEQRKTQRQCKHRRKFCPDSRCAQPVQTNAGEHRGIHGTRLRQRVRTEQRKAEHDHEQDLQAARKIAHRPEIRERPGSRRSLQARKTSRATVPRGQTSSLRHATGRLRKIRETG